jgi:hypothetical protein
MKRQPVFIDKDSQAPGTPPVKTETENGDIATPKEQAGAN